MSEKDSAEKKGVEDEPVYNKKDFGIAFWQMERKGSQPERVPGIIHVRPDTSDTAKPHSSRNW